MAFQTPAALLGLLALPLLAGLYLLGQRRRRKYAVRFTNLDLLGHVAGRQPGVRRHLPAVLFLVALSGLLVSFAGPKATIAIPRPRASVMLVMDVSGSMAASDIQPSRMAAAKRAAHSLVDALPSNASIGLVAFSSRARVVVPLSQDRDQLLPSIDGLTPGGGTALGDGLDLAVEQLQAVQRDQSGQPPPSMVVMLSDGAANAGVPPDQAAARAATANIPVETVGVGSRTAGATVQGQQVGAVDEETLQRIADATQGHYSFAGDSGSLKRIYSSLGERFGWRRETVDLTVPMAIAGTAVMVIAALLSLRWFRVLP